MHVELDGLRLLLVFEMVISQEVVELIHHWRGGVGPFWEAGHLGDEGARIRGDGVRVSDGTSNAANPGPFTSAQDRHYFWYRAGKEAKVQKRQCQGKTDGT